jgi:hypothetical protein
MMALLDELGEALGRFLETKFSVVDGMVSFPFGS